MYLCRFSAYLCCVFGDFWRINRPGEWSYCLSDLYPMAQRNKRAGDRGVAKTLVVRRGVEKTGGADGAVIKVLTFLRRF